MRDRRGGGTIPMYRKARCMQMDSFEPIRDGVRGMSVQRLLETRTVRYVGLTLLALSCLLDFARSPVVANLAGQRGQTVHLTPISVARDAPYRPLHPGREAFKGW